MQYRWKTLVLVLTVILISAGNSLAAPYFRGTGLMNIPTAFIMQEGVFDAGIHTAIRDQKRDELGVRMDFGIFNFAELGLTALKKDGEDYIMGNFKLIISRESGSTPALSVGLDNFGEKFSGSSGEYEGSVYAVVSKKFNLPIAHYINFHLGIGNNRYVSEDEDSIGKYLHGVFMGLSKDFGVPFLDSQLRLMGETDGKYLNIGLKYAMKSGLSLSFATGQLGSDPKKIKYYLGVNFSNEPMMQEMSQISKLAELAVKIANEAKSKIEGGGEKSLPYQPKK